MGVFGLGAVTRYCTQLNACSSKLGNYLIWIDS